MRKVLQHAPTGARGNTVQQASHETDSGGAEVANQKLHAPQRPNVRIGARGQPKLYCVDAQPSVMRGSLKGILMTAASRGMQLQQVAENPARQVGDVRTPLAAVYEHETDIAGPTSWIHALQVHVIRVLTALPMHVGTNSEAALRAPTADAPAPSPLAVGPAA